MRLSGPPRSRPGTAAVEFALVGSLFFLLVFGIFELGRVLMVQHLLTNAARQACRAGVIPGVSTEQMTTLANQALANQGVRSGTVTVQVNGGPTDALLAASGDAITVVVSVPTARVSWVPGSRFVVGNVTGRYTLRRE